MTERKLDLERRIQLLQGEREGLSSTLDESADRIIMLEKQSREQDSLLRTNEKAMEELRSNNQALQERLETMYRSMSLSPGQTTGNISLQNEMELSDSERSGVRPQRLFSVDDDDVECDHPPGTSIAGLEARQLKEETLSAYQQVRALSAQLRRREKQVRQQAAARRASKAKELADELDEEEAIANAVGDGHPSSASTESSSSDEATTVDSVKPSMLKACVQV